ncbi:MAG: hypothetical protein K2H53_06135 [Clostridia bacterium]|nr:hypothetical protein [Clostridia bacterium]
MEIEEIIENEKEVQNTMENKLDNNIENKFNTGLGEVTIEENQNKFLEGTLGKVINTGIDIALRAILPNAIEDEVIRNKKCNNE